MTSEQVMLSNSDASVGREADDCDPTDCEPDCCEATEQSDCPTPLSWRGVLKRFQTDTEQFVVEREGYQLYGRSWGDGPPVYFLNGWGGTSELFALIAVLLSEDFRCVLYDEFRSGTPVRFGRVRPQQAVQDLFAVAEHCGDARFSLYGSSVGGGVGLSAMLEQPLRIDRAVLQGAFAHRQLSVMERIMVRCFQTLPGTMARLPLREAIQRQNHLPWFPPFDRSRWQFLLDDTGSVPLTVLARRASIARGIDLRNQLAKIQQTVLIVDTEGEGRITAQCQEQLDLGLAQSRRELIDNTGQVPFLTHPHRLAKLIRPFLRGEED